MWTSRKRRSTQGTAGTAPPAEAATQAGYYHGVAADGLFTGGYAPSVLDPNEVPAFTIPSTATYTYDPFEPTHKMAYDWAPLKYLDPSNTETSWGTPPVYTPQDLGTIVATGPNAGSVVWSIPNSRATRGIQLVTSTPGQCTVRMWSDREFHNATLGATRSFVVTGTAGGVDHTCTVTLNADFSGYTSIPGWTGIYAGITHHVGITSELSDLTPFPAYGGSYPTGWTMIEVVYTGFNAGTLDTNMKWYYIRPTMDGASLSGYDCSGLALRNDGNAGAGYDNITIENCYFDGSVWGMSPVCATHTTTINPNGVGSNLAVVGSMSNINVGSILVGNSDYPAGTYVTARNTTVTGSGDGAVGFYGNGTGGSAVITDIADTSILSVGWTLAKNDCMPSTRTIASIDSPTQITLSGTLSGTQVYDNIFFYTTVGPPDLTITLSAAAVADSGAVSTTFVRGTTLELISFPNASSKTVTFTDCTIDMKGDEYPWFTNGIVTRHPNQSFIRCSCLNAPNDNGNFNGGTYTRFYASAMGSNNWSLNNNGIGFLPRGWEVSAGNYWGHCDNLQGFNVNQNFTLTESYLDDRWFHVDPLKEDIVSGGTAAMFMESNTTGSMTATDSICRGGTYGMRFGGSSANTEALSSFARVLFDADSNLGQATLSKPQIQAYDCYYLLDWQARIDVSQPAGGNPTGAILAYKGDPYGVEINPPIEAPTLSIAAQGSNYVRLSFARQNNTSYEARWRTTAGPGAWSTPEAFEDIDLGLFVPGGFASPDWAASTGYDVQVRGYNSYCVGNPSGTRLVADGPWADISLTTSAATSLDSDFSAIAATFATAPTTYEEDGLNTFILAVKAEPGLWTALGHLFFASAGSSTSDAEDRSLINWKSPGTAYTKVGSPVWAASYGGATANASGSNYIRSGWKPFFGGDTLALQDDNCIGWYTITAGNSLNSAHAANPRLGGTLRMFGANVALRSSTSTDHTSTSSPSPWTGMAMISRTASTEYTVYHGPVNGTLASIATVTATSTSGVDSELLFLGRNASTGGISVDRTQRDYLGLVYAGRGLTQAQGQALQDAFEAWLTWVGVY